MSCCRNDLGSFPHNRDINTGILVPAAGKYELRFHAPNWAVFSVFQVLASGEEVVIPQGLLNEDFQYDMEIVKTDGTMIEQDDCSTFSFRTFINKVSCDDIDYL